MKKFLKNCILILLFVVIIIGTSKIFVPYYWGNSNFATKILYLKKNQNTYNSFFFGSSIVHHQINPKIFDSIVNQKTSEKIKSFNLGSPATFPPQSYYLYENFLKKDLNPSTKYIFIQLKELSIPSRPVRDEYWQNFSDVLFLFRTVHEDKTLNFRRKFAYYRHTIYRYTKNIFADNQLGTYLFTTNFYDSIYLGENNNGFVSLEYQYEHTTNETNKSGMKELRNKLLDEKFKVRELNANDVKNMIDQVGNEVSSTHLNRMLHLIDISNEKGVQLIFFISPRTTNQNIIDIYKQLPEKHKIEFSQSLGFSELFKKENLYDEGHLNTKGSNLYCKIFADEFVKMVDK